MPGNWNPFMMNDGDKKRIKKEGIKKLNKLTGDG